MKFFNKAIAGVLAAAVMISSVSYLPDEFIENDTGLITGTVEAAGYEGIGYLQILSTADIHGQSIAYDYTTASGGKAGSLAQIVKIVRSLKKSIKNGATLLVDSGDDTYGYGAETLMDGATSGVEYLFEEFADAKYDAITLGNHDFDYGLDYIQQQLNQSGMNSKVVLSNVYNAKTKKPLWSQSKIIQKTLTTTGGVKETVKIGVVGAVVPSLTTYFDWQDTISTGDIVETVRQQADALKGAGCDVVVVLAHSGIGEENPASGSDNVAYALTKLSSVDVVCAGHTHRNFPSNDTNVQTYYDYKGVDDDTGLVNGKILVQEADHGQALGISKLKLSFTDGRASIVGRSVRVRKIKSSDKQASSIVKINKTYDKLFASQYNSKIASSDYVIANYFGMFEDIPLVQMVNESKIAYGMRIINESFPEYKNYPVISATSFPASGANGSEDYAIIEGSFKKKDLMKFQATTLNRLKLYRITGKQLRETLEWEAAAAYETAGKTASDTWSDEKMESLAGKGYESLLNNSWLNNWSGHTIYDGIEYTVDMTQKPRYNRAGELTHEDSHRITSLTCNGKNVTDSSEFVLVSIGITANRNPVIGKKMKNQVIKGKLAYPSDVFEDYVKSQSPNKKFHSYLTADDNVTLDCPEGNYIVKTSDSGESYAASSKDWYVDEVATSNGYGYYSVKLGGDKSDTSGPLLIAAPLKVSTTGDPVTIRVYTTDKSGVSKVEYKPGVCTADQSDWNGATAVTSSFKVIANGVYSIRALDKKGNATIRYVDIENINTEVSDAPKVNNFNNKKTAITGSATAGATIYVKVGGVQYSGKASGSGEFSIDVPRQKAGRKITTWQVDTKGRKSSKVVTYVIRRGGNMPDIDGLNNKNAYLRGNLNDSKYCTIAAIYGGGIYIPEQMVSYYMLSSIYKKGKYTVHKMNCTYSEDGSFKLAIPYMKAGKKVTVYNIDWNGRLSSPTALSVEEVAPNVPTVGSNVISEEGVVTGKLVEPVAGRTYRAFVAEDDVRTYADVDENGRFMIDVEDGFSAGETIEVGVQDFVDGAWRTSIKQTRTAQSMTSFEDLVTDDVLFDDDYDDKMDSLSGMVEDYTGTITLLGPGEKQTISVNEDNEFEYTKSSLFKKNTSYGLILRGGNNGIKIFGYTTVTEAAPEAPEWITEEITEDTTKVKYVCEDKDPAYLKVGSKVYTPKRKEYSDSKGGYVYVFVIKKPKKGQMVKGYLKNTGGYSKKITLTVKKGKKKKKKNTEEELQNQTETL